MESFSIFIAFLIGVLMTLICFAIWGDNNKYCNSSYSRGKDSLDIELDKPEYKVEKVERCYCKNNMAEICKYTILNFYKAGKNKVKLQELYFYDKIGAYNVGDILTLENLAKYNKEEATIQRAVGYLTNRTGLYADDIERFKKYMKGE